MVDVFSEGVLKTWFGDRAGGANQTGAVNACTISGEEHRRRKIPAVAFVHPLGRPNRIVHGVGLNLAQICRYRMGCVRSNSSYRTIPWSRPNRLFGPCSTSLGGLQQPWRRQPARRVQGARPGSFGVVASKRPTIPSQPRACQPRWRARAHQRGVGTRLQRRRIGSSCRLCAQMTNRSHESHGSVNNQ